MQATSEKMNKKLEIVIFAKFELRRDHRKKAILAPVKLIPDEICDLPQSL
jgi:hypothetical protein